MSALQTRQPAGAPTGGQFATAARPEPNVHIDYLDDFPLAPGVTESDRDLYTNEHCEQLAWALHEATGWPYAAVCDLYDEPSSTFGWLHMAVMAPDGKVLDVEGMHEADDTLDTYGGGSEAEDGDSWLIVTPESTGLASTKEPMTDAEKERARRVAAALLAHHRTEEMSS